jgi:hypothetical protein
MKRGSQELILGHRTHCRQTQQASSPRLVFKKRELGGDGLRRGSIGSQRLLGMAPIDKMDLPSERAPRKVPGGADEKITESVSIDIPHRPNGRPGSGAEAYSRKRSNSRFRNRQDTPRGRLWRRKDQDLARFTTSQREAPKKKLRESIAGEILSA